MSVPGACAENSICAVHEMLEVATGEKIAAGDFNAVEAKSFLQGQGYNIEIKQEKLELTISAESVVSTDERFTMDR